MLEELLNLDVALAVRTVIPEDKIALIQATQVLVYGNVLVREDAPLDPLRAVG